MTKNQSGTGEASGQRDVAKALRERAEEKVRSSFASKSAQAGEEGKVLHELRVREAQLDMQNEELRAIQEELGTARAKYFDLYNLAPVGYFTIGTQGEIVETNLAAALLLGSERGRFSGEKFTRLVAAEDQDVYYLFHKKLMETGTLQACEVRMMRPDGVLFWAHLKATVVDSESGEPVCNVVMSDITERKKADEVIGRSETRYRRLFESTQDGVLLLNADTGQILDVNPFLLDMLGYSHKDFLGKKLWEIGPFADIAASRIRFSELQTKEYVRYENLPLETKDGRPVDVEFVSNVYLVNNDKIIQCNIRDITLRKKVEEKLQRSETRYRRLFESTQDGVLLLNADTGQILDVNPFLLDMLGYSHKDFLGKKLWEIGPFADIAASRIRFSELQTKEYVRYENLPLETKDGRPVDVEFVSNVYLVNNDKIIQCNIRDITLRKKVEEALRKVFDEMGLRVTERTEDLVEASQNLLREIEERKKAEDSLREALTKIEQFKDQLHVENTYLKEEFNLLHSHKNIVGGSEAIRAVLKQIEQVAGTESTVLIQGETGTGKELVANATHGLSIRKDRLMIKVNCAALPATLVESELFGREKGAFTGALSKEIGRFELADASTIFLDEVDSLPLELQAKLLRILESGEFERLGSPRTLKVDVRIISATNRDLAKLVSEGSFREDLYYRLNIFQITVPSLRERQEDILPLIWSFVQEFSKRMGKRVESIPQKGVEALQAYFWPGNVRELRNVVERAMILTTGPVLHLDVPKTARLGVGQSGTLEKAEKRHIIEALNSTGWRVSGKGGAADILGINPKTLASRMHKLGIQRNKKDKETSPDNKDGVKAPVLMKLDPSRP